MSEYPQGLIDALQAERTAFLHDRIREVDAFLEKHPKSTELEMLLGVPRAVEIGNRHYAALLAELVHYGRLPPRCACLRKKKSK